MVNRTETDRLKSKPVSFNLRPLLWVLAQDEAVNLFEDFETMGKTDHDQHQIA